MLLNCGSGELKGSAPPPDRVQIRMCSGLREPDMAFSVCRRLIRVGENYTPGSNATVRCRDLGV